MPEVSLLFNEDLVTYIVFKSGSIIPMRVEAVKKIRGKKFKGQSSYNGQHAEEIEKVLGHTVLFLTPKEYLEQVIPGAFIEKNHRFLEMAELIVFSNRK
jgi:hypothetical protein